MRTTIDTNDPRKNLSVAAKDCIALINGMGLYSLYAAPHPSV